MGWASKWRGPLARGYVIFVFLRFLTEVSGSPKTPNRPSVEIMTAEGLKFLITLMLIYVKRANFTTRLLLWTKFFAFPPPRGVLNKVLSLEAPSQGPTPYSFIYHFWQKKVPLSYTFQTKQVIPLSSELCIPCESHQMLLGWGITSVK